MNKFIMILLVCLTAENSIAAGKIPDMDRWIKTVIPKLDSSRLMQKILFVKQDGDKFTPWMPIARKDSSSLMNMEFLSLINPSDLEVCSNINLQISKESKTSFKLPEKGPKALAAYFKCSKADTIITGGPKVKRWTFYKRKSDGNIAKVYKAKGPKALDKRSMSQWLRKKLGFDGIVLAREGDFVLAGLMSKAKSNKIQALLLKDSQYKFRIRGKKGAALLQLLKTKNGYGLFEIVIKSSDISDANYSKVLFNAK